MDEEKRNKVTAAVVVNAILLVLIIVAVLIAQVVQISILKRRKAALIDEYNSLVLLLERTENVIDRAEIDNKLQDLIKQMYDAGMTEEEIKAALLSTTADAQELQTILVVPDFSL